MAEDTSAMVEQRTREAYERLTSKWENREKEHKRKQREDESVSSFNDWLNKEERPRQRRELEAFNKKQGLNTERIQLTTNSLLAAVKQWISALAFMRQCGEQLYQCDGRWAIQAYDLLHELDVRELPVAPCKPTNGWTIEAEIRALESVRNTLVDNPQSVKRNGKWEKLLEIYGEERNSNPEAKESAVRQNAVNRYNKHVKGKNRPKGKGKYVAATRAILTRELRR